MVWKSTRLAESRPSTEPNAASAERADGREDRPVRPKLAVAVGMGWGVRNYLLNDTLSILKERFDLVIYSSFGDLPGFRKQFEDQGIEVRPIVDPESVPWLAAPMRWAQISGYRRHPTVSRKTKFSLMMKRELRKQGQLSVKIRAARQKWGPGGSRGWKEGVVAIHRLVRRLVGAVWRLFELCALRVFGPPLFAHFLKLFRGAMRRWRPVVELRKTFRQEGVVGVFSTGFNVTDEWAPVIAAHAERLPVMTSIYSWDQATSKPFLLCDYDAIFVWGRTMKTQTLKYLNAFSPNRIHIVGPPQLDYLQRPELQLSREEFCRRYGLDPARKIVVFSTVAPGLSPDQSEVLRQFHEIFKRMPGSPQLLVRVHPKDTTDRYSDVKDALEREGVVWTLAGEPLMRTRDRWCPDEEDILRAVNTIRHGDVNVHCCYSTMMLEFCSQDKPVIVIAYNSRGDTGPITHYEPYEHLQAIVASAAVQIAYTSQQTETYLRRAIEHPELDREARARICQTELGPLDGRAGARTAEVIIETVERALARSRSG